MSDAAKKVEPAKEPWGDHTPLTDHRWFVIATEPRKEQKAYDILASMGFIMYLPLINVQRPHGRGNIVSLTVPLFPRYLFSLISLKRDPWQRVYSTPWCRGILGTPASGERVLTFREMATIHSMADQLATEPPVDEHGRPLEIGGMRKGDRVRVTAGPFYGFEGPIEQLDDADRITVGLQIFGGVTPVIMSLAQLAKAR